MPNNEKRLFIVFEGVEGSGKSTQSKLLSRRLSDKSIENIGLREPGGTPTGESVRSWLAKATDLDAYAELFLFSAARTMLIKQKIIPSFEENKVVILDRYIYSTIAYQGFAQGLGRDVIDHVNKIATGGIVPDKVFLLDISPELSFERKKRDTLDRWESEKLDFHNKVRKGYLALSKENPGVWHVLDATASEEEVHNLVWESIRKLLQLA